jgi:hypothetical protein
MCHTKESTGDSVWSWLEFVGESSIDSSTINGSLNPLLKLIVKLSNFKLKSFWLKLQKKIESLFLVNVEIIFLDGLICEALFYES